MNTNVLIAIDAVLQLARTMQQIADVIARAQSEGRDISDDELIDLRRHREEVYGLVFGPKA
ncbi:MAG: hypothetical protein ACREXT_20335 [Gammaproteobacteria bacterium]